MLGQVARRCQRGAAGEQPGAADRHDDGVEQPLRARARVLPVAEADRHVDVVGVEIPQRIGNIETQFQPWVRGPELRQPGQQPVGRETGAGRQPQRRRPARHAPGAAGGATQRVEGVGGGLEPHGAGRREADAAAGAREQHHAELLLDLLDLVAHGRRRQPDFFGGPCEVQVPPGGLEGAQGAGAGDQLGLHRSSNSF
ncbi:hypothetical protein D9M69_581070 [compost metagenome]